MPRFEPANLADSLPQASGYCVAYSGGCDSHALLHALAGQQERLPGPLRALHVDHALQPDSGRWSRHCERVCVGLGIPCETLRVDARPARGESPEAAAREARYRALKERLRPGEALLTAQHRDDQAETLLLQLLRGAGPRGLAGMAPVAPFGAGLLVRPLLHLPRAALRDYAERQRLAWIDDPSNDDPAFDRNFLRLQVMPTIERRWPAAATCLARAAGHQVEATGLLAELADLDLEPLLDGSALEIPGLLRLAPARRRNLLRRWLERLQLPPPARTHLDHLLDQVIEAADDAAPCLRWPGVEVRRYRDRLHAMPPLPAHDPAREWSWDGQGVLRLGEWELWCEAAPEGGIPAERFASGAVTVRFRRGGERCRVEASGPSRPLKKLLQEAAIPPWLRDRLPLVYVGEELVVVAGLTGCVWGGADPSLPGCLIRWRRQDDPACLFTNAKGTMPRGVKGR